MTFKKFKINFYYMRIIAGLLIILFAISGFPIVSTYTPMSHTDIDTKKLSATPTITRDWTVKIVLVNYDDGVINENVLTSDFPQARLYTTTEVAVEYNIAYEISTASPSWESSLQDVMDSNSVNGTDTGSKLDETALEYQKAHLDEPQKIFNSRDGRAIDGYAVEDWLIENPAVTPPDLGYVFYLLNFSEYDSPDHELEHWFDYHPIDPDTGLNQSWFRLEWDNELNKDVKFQFAGIGGRGNIYVLDPSADQWYLRWARIWWGEAPYPNDFEHCTKDLEDKVSELDLSTTGGKDALSTYLGDYMYDPISYLMFAHEHQPTVRATSGLLRGLVFGMDVSSGVSIESLQWVTDAEIQKAHLAELLPFIDWTVEIDFLNIEEQADWETVFWSYAEVVDGVTQVDGYSQFYAIREILRDNYITDLTDRVEVFGVVFIKKMMEMYAGGRTFTGLGGGGQTVIWKSWERYYQEDGVTPKSGISSIQLHETMHAVGIGHTWNTYHYVGDFSFSPMGYFSMHNGTATFDQNWVQSTYLDQMQGRIVEDYEDYSEGILADDLPKVLKARDEAEAAINLAVQLYNQMVWIGCFEALSDAQDWVKRLRYSRIDNAQPIISNWGTDPLTIDHEEFDVWIEVEDPDSGIENVTLILSIDNELSYVLCELDDDEYSAHIPAYPNSESMAIQVVAHDWGMNPVALDWRILYGDPILPDPTIPNPTNPLMLQVILISLSGIGLVIVVAFIIKRK
ncbi:MAG: hypothetical protein GF411_03615 [Candidatus Lokiarchaeota archaeon]|nr:hypothetical protein [Candidatus Lokiarchaeota archaeon]